MCFCVFLLSGALAEDDLSVPIQLHEQGVVPEVPVPSATAAAEEKPAPLLDQQIVATAAGGTTTSVPVGVAALFPDLTLVGPPIFCPASKVLLLPANGGSLPTTWSTLAVEQQAQNPIVLDFLQLAAIANSPKASAFSKCLEPWGVPTANTRQVFQKWTYNGKRAINNAYVFSAGKTIFVTLRGQHGDAVDNASALATATALGITVPQAAVHTGYLAAYNKLIVPLTNAINGVKAQAKIMGSAPIWITGHSSGGALSFLLAFALTSGKITGYSVQGVVTFGAPRVGNVEFQTNYNNLLLSTKTLRISNDGDYATETFPYADPTNIPSSYTNVGRGATLCATTEGLATFVYPVDDANAGACLLNSVADITPAQAAVLSGQHALGNYFDSWRRAYFQTTGSNLANDMRLRAVLCVPCAWPVLAGGISFTNTNQDQLLLYIPWNYPARIGGPPFVTCLNDASCANPTAYNAATAINWGYTAFYKPNGRCNTQTMLNGTVPPIYNCDWPKSG